MKGNVLIIGLGLIGGSIALGIKKEHPNCQIFGYDINEEQRRLAKTLHVIDEIVDDLHKIIPISDFIFIAVPVKQTEMLLKDMEELEFKKNVIISDVGSTKVKIVEKAEGLRRRGITFIGGHPMAGSHKSGVVAAKAHLFENAFYILTPHDDQAQKEIAQLKYLLNGTKANFIILTPKEHDEVAGVISHFPHIIAVGLVHQARNYSENHHLVSRLAAGGFRDITRIASSNPIMWRDILLHNKESLLEMFDSWMKEMETVRHFIATDSSDQIYQYFASAKDFRDDLPTRTKGAIPSFYDLFVDVPDYPGIISEITGYLAESNISITNIRIIETREEIYGVLRLSFQSEEDRESAKLCIESNTNYETFYG
ncbi:prephenate dehydrogenase [Bacillus sp. PS06]|uniref:prephenate dehydrogenase n=1 Tax=Bacillus sp. PS06 TaxID=2764176 RepID=UPI00178657D0|nr:prephenate dehydrogenase [Bacillus sp. PS06]MBD8070241.1 prephenate dehydrogenase [Bacillus sp. PS06]